jgi:hypothetical protein
MGRKRNPGLVMQARICHIAKCVFGRRVRQSITANETWKTTSAGSGAHALRWNSTSCTPARLQS